MNIKTVVTAVLGAVAGLGLAMGTMAWAQNTNHMGTTQATQQTNSNSSMHGNTAFRGNSSQGMMGQTTPQNTKGLDTHGQMHGKTAATQTGGMMGQSTGGMMGQSTSGMMGQNGAGNVSNMHQQAPAPTHHAGYKPAPVLNTPCNTGTTIKSGAKT